MTLIISIQVRRQASLATKEKTLVVVVLWLCQSGEIGSPCIEDEHCNERHCVTDPFVVDAMPVCTSGEVGAVCAADEDCNEEVCYMGRCRLRPCLSCNEAWSQNSRDICPEAATLLEDVEACECAEEPEGCLDSCRSYCDGGTGRPFDCQTCSSERCEAEVSACLRDLPW
jgi:hypothetical protein